MIDILNLTFPELERFIVEDLGQPKFRAAQVWQWIWQKHATSFDAMTDVSKQLRAKLAEVAEIVLPEIVTVQTSSDGTEKLLLRLRDGALVETVILPSTGQDGSVRIAQCVSSQIGCAMGCTFCSTGTMGFIRNMTAGEIPEPGSRGPYAARRQPHRPPHYPQPRLHGHGRASAQPARNHPRT